MKKLRLGSVSMWSRQAFFSRRSKNRQGRRPVADVVFTFSFFLFPFALEAGEYFRITVRDAETNRGVPLVELRTVNNLRYYTDSNGIVAFHEPGLMNRSVYFAVKSHGYEFAKDSFGYRGKRLKVVPGGSAELRVRRINIAERLYRVTGAGIYRDSLLVGRPVPIQKPVLNGLVFGSDSVVNAVYKGKIYWFWGDTNRPSYPLGNFHVPGATSRLPDDGGLDPEVGVDLDYFLDQSGFAKPTAQMPGTGPTWINGLVSLKDRTGRERLFASYVKVKKPLTVYQRGLVEFNDQKQQFEKRVQFDMKSPMFPAGHPLKHVDGGVEYVYFPNPFPVVRVVATPESLQDLSKYEAFTCLKQGSRADAPVLDRDQHGRLRYDWKTDTPPLTKQIRTTLFKQKLLRAEERLFQLRDVETGKHIAAHGGSVYWNGYRKRWVMIVLESFGTSLLGEIWYAEGDTPLGPWVYARKIITHDKYSFYNPKQHPMFDKDDGRVLFLEGTYTSTFSGNPDRTPRYNYNQILYKLTLSDPRLALPVPVYLLDEQHQADHFATRQQLGPSRKPLQIAFFAPDRPALGTVAVFAETTAEGGRILKVAARSNSAHEKKSLPLFYGLPAETKEQPDRAVPLFEFVHKDGKQRAYSTERDFSRPGFRRSARPLCLVWRNPLPPTLPLDVTRGLTSPARRQR